MDVYHAATAEEMTHVDMDESYDLLIGPDGFECFLGEPEDRCWSRDAKAVVTRLNRLHTALEQANRLRVHCDHCGGDYAQTGVETGCPCQLRERITALELEVRDHRAQAEVAAVHLEGASRSRILAALGASDIDDGIAKIAALRQQLARLEQISAARLAHIKTHRNSQERWEKQVAHLVEERRKTAKDSLARITELEEVVRTLSLRDAQHQADSGVVVTPPRIGGTS